MLCPQQLHCVCKGEFAHGPPWPPPAGGARGAARGARCATGGQAAGRRAVYSAPGRADAEPSEGGAQGNCAPGKCRAKRARSPGLWLKVFILTRRCRPCLLGAGAGAGPVPLPGQPMHALPPGVPHLRESKPTLRCAALQATGGPASVRLMSEGEADRRLQEWGEPCCLPLWAGLPLASPLASGTPCSCAHSCRALRRMQRALRMLPAAASAPRAACLRGWLRGRRRPPPPCSTPHMPHLPARCPATPPAPSPGRLLCVLWCSDGRAEVADV